MSDLRLRRSVLYMPGSNQRALEKARTLAADSLILDLEDAVAPDAKEIAREQVCAAVKEGGYGNREIIIRVNAPQTPWGESDLKAAIQARPDAILMPKVSWCFHLSVTLHRRSGLVSVQGLTYRWKKTRKVLKRWWSSGMEQLKNRTLPAPYHPSMPGI